MRAAKVENLRATVAEPGFFVGVLDFLASDEALLLSFATNSGRDAGRDRAGEAERYLYSDALAESPHTF